MFENLIVNSVAPLIQKIPYVDLSGVFDIPGVQTFIDILSVISYFFPWGTVLSIVGIIIGFQTLRLIVAFLKTLWGVLPIA